MATHSRTELLHHFRTSYHSHRNPHHKRLSLLGDEDNLLTMTIRHPQSVSTAGSVDVQWLQWFEAERRVKEELVFINDCSMNCLCV